MVHNHLNLVDEHAEQDFLLQLLQKTSVSSRHSTKIPILNQETLTLRAAARMHQLSVGPSRLFTNMSNISDVTDVDVTRSEGSGELFFVALSGQVHSKALFKENVLIFHSNFIRSSPDGS